LLRIMKGIQTSKSIWLILGIIVIVAGLLRGAFFIQQMRIFQLSGDALNYHIMAHQLVEDHLYGYALARKSGESNSYITPGYPVFLAGVYSVIQDPYLQITAVRLIQIAIGTLTPVFAFLFLRRIFRRNDIGIVTALLIAIYPPFVQAPVQLLTEVLAMATMLLYLWLMTAALETRKWSHSVLAGLIFAVQILIRPVMLPLAIVPFIYALATCYRGNIAGLFKVGVQTAIGVLILMLPWWIRNYIVLDKLILTATGSANPLLAGTYPNMEHMFEDFKQAGYKSTEQSWYAKKRIIEGFTTQPLVFLKWYTIGKTKVMFQTPWLYQELYKTPPFYGFNLAFHPIVMWTGFVGMLVGLFTNRVMRFLTVYAALFLSLYLIFIPTTRYAYQVIFFVMTGAAFLVCWLAEKLFYRKTAM
jgi:4-amino-4-deoxy-L-arabinose transferase-like glycosyltransferase